MNGSKNNIRGCSSLRVIVIVLGMIPALSLGQLQSIKAFSGYSYATGKRLSVNQATAVGGGVQVKYAVAGDISFNVSFGYTLYSLSQTDQLTAWGWDFWNNRYSNTIKSNIQADPALSVEIGSIQKMDILPLVIGAEYAFRPDEDLSINPSISAGIIFFTRRMYAEETWSKKFNQANYTFTYSYRNFAPEKKGNKIAVIPGCTVAYRLFENINIVTGIQYTQYVSVKSMIGYDEFPLNHEVNLSLGLDFVY